MIDVFKNKKLQLLIEQGLFSGSSFLSHLLLINLVDLKQFGVFASLSIVVYLLLSIVQALVVQPMQINLPKFKHSGAYKMTVLLLTLGLALTLSIGVAFVLVLDMVSLSEFRPYLDVFFIYGMFIMVFDFFRKYFLAVDQISHAVLISTFYLASIALGYSIGYLHGIHDIRFYLIVLTLAYLPSLVYACFRYIDKLKIPSKEELKKYANVHIVEGQWLLYASIVQWLSSNLYVMTSGLLIGLEALGVLRFIQTIFGILNILLQSIENYVLPRLSEKYIESIEGFYALFQKYAGKYILVIWSALLVMFIFAEDLLLLLGNADIASYAYVLKGMVILYCIIILAYPIRLLIRITERNKYYFLAYLVSFVFSLFSYNYLLDSFGVSGAVAGLMINQVILLSTWVLALSKNQIKVWKLYI